jgi:uncharacterized membrane protein YhfC
MRVDPNSLVFAAISLIISVVVPIVLYFYLRKKYQIGWKTVLVGAITWFVTTQLLEQLLHFFVLQNKLVVGNPYIFGLYGAISAGLFEELGRYFAFTKYLKGKEEWKDGVGYGLGHGGIESILFGILGGIQTIGLLSIFSTGKVAELQKQLPKDVFAELAKSVQSPGYMFLVSGVERMLALIFQIFLSLIVLYGVKKKKFVFVVYAVLLHALVDFAPALYQAKVLNLWVVEGLLVVVGAISFYGIVKFMKKYVSI